MRLMSVVTGFSNVPMTPAVYLTRH